MKYIGCDFHPSFQPMAMLDKETGEWVERQLLHTEEARSFYGSSAKALRFQPRSILGAHLPKQLV